MNRKYFCIKKIYLSLIIIISPFIATAENDSEHYAEKEDVKPAISIYIYDPENPPETFFFPKAKARWDGNKITLKEWYLLTPLQKEKFISEYVSELKSSYRMPVEAFGIESDYLSALNMFSAYSDTKTMNEPSTKFIDILLSGQGMISHSNKNENNAR